jgi:predicted nucleotidyltransferase
MLLGDLRKKGLIDPPPWMDTNTCFLAIIGSHAYGVADTSVRDKIPDYDIYGFAVPPKVMLFKHLTGWIPGFGPEPPGFDQWQKHKVVDEQANGGVGKEWDFQIFSIVKFFELCRGNNPNLMDVLYVPVNCVVHSTSIGNTVRESRHLFLSKQCWPRFKGYAYAQLHKMSSKKPSGKRKEIRDRYGFDVKFAYHVVRLLSEVEQILTEGDLDLQEKGRREHMKAIRRGEISEDDIRQWAGDKEKQLEAAYVECKLPERPPVEPLRELLYNCLEEHYGTLEGCVEQLGWAESCLKEIDELLGKNRRKLYA